MRADEAVQVRRDRMIEKFSPGWKERVFVLSVFKWWSAWMEPDYVYHR